jgi:hypothetical protein
MVEAIPTLKERSLFTNLEASDMLSARTLCARTLRGVTGARTRRQLLLEVRNLPWT